MLKKLVFISILTILSLLIVSSQYVLAEISLTVPENIIANLYMANTLGKINNMTVEMDLYNTETDKYKNKPEAIYSIKSDFLAPNKVRIEIISYFKGEAYICGIQMRNGNIERGWATCHHCGRFFKEDDHRHSNFLPFNTDTQPQDLYRKYSLAGEEKLYGKDVYVINIDNEKDSHIKFLTVWIDKELFIPIKEEHINRDAKGTEIKKTTIYKEPKQMTDGRWIPFRVELYDNDKMINYILYKNVIINQGLSEDLFNPSNL